MSVFDLLAQLADTAHLQDADPRHLFIVLPQGHRLRVAQLKSGGVNITSESLSFSLGHERETAAWKVQQKDLAKLPPAGFTWAKEPEVRWAQMQAFLRSHAQRPMVLNHLLTTLGMTLFSNLGPELVVKFSSSGQGTLALDGERRDLSYSDRICALAERTVQAYSGIFLPWGNTLLRIPMPATMHARLQWRQTHGPDSIEPQIAQLEAAWLGRTRPSA